MQTKLIALAATAYGALIAWAVTADHYEQKLTEQKKAYDDYIDELKNRPVHLTQNIYSSGNNEDAVAVYQQTKEFLEKGQNGGENGKEALIPTDETFPDAGSEEDVSPEAENPRGDETPEADEAGVTDGERSVPPGETPEETEARLKGIINQYTLDDDTNGQQDVAHIGTSMVYDPKPPFVISKALFVSDPDEGNFYEKETLTYYPSHRVLLDDDEELIDNVATVIGWKNLNRFGDESEDPDIVFVRNQRLNTDYEVVREEDEPLPLHIKYSMGKDEFETAKAAGILRLRDEDLVD
jgi:hypothetical protein